MPNVDKLVKNLFNEIDETKRILQTAVRNQETVISQNQRMLELLTQINTAVQSIKNN